MAKEQLTLSYFARRIKECESKGHQWNYTKTKWWTGRDIFELYYIRYCDHCLVTEQSIDRPDWWPLGEDWGPQNDNEVP